MYTISNLSAKTKLLPDQRNLFGSFSHFYVKICKELEAKTTLGFESVRRDIKELEAKTIQGMKELELNSKNQSELLRRDLKIGFGGMLVTLVIAMSGIFAMMAHLGGHS